MNWKAALGALSVLGLSLASCGGAGEPSSTETAERVEELTLLPVTTALVSTESQVRDIAAGGGDVYWISAKVADPNFPTDSLGRVAHVSKHGGAVHVVASAQHGGGSVALNGKSVFWTATATSQGSTVPAIFMAPRGGGAVKRFAPTWTGFVPAIDPGNAPEDPPYLLADDLRVFALGAEHRLYRIPISSQEPEFLVEGANHSSIALSNREVFESECRTCGGFIAETQKSAPVIDDHQGAAGTQFIEGDDTTCCVWSMAATHSTLYWASVFNGILTAPLNGAPNAPGPAVTLVPPSSSLDEAVRWIALVAPNLYWSTANGALKRVAQTGGEVSTLVSSGVNPDVRIVADSDSVYWVSADGGSIERTRVR